MYEKKVLNPLGILSFEHRQKQGQQEVSSSTEPAKDSANFNNDTLTDSSSEESSITAKETGGNETDEDLVEPEAARNVEQSEDLHEEEAKADIPYRSTSKDPDATASYSDAAVPLEVANATGGSATEGDTLDFIEEGTAVPPEAVKVAAAVPSDSTEVVAPVGSETEGDILDFIEEETWDDVAFIDTQESGSVPEDDEGEVTELERDEDSSAVDEPPPTKPLLAAVPKERETYS